MIWSAQAFFLNADTILAGHSTHFTEPSPSSNSRGHYNLKRCELFCARDLTQFPISISSFFIPNFELLGPRIGDFNICSGFITKSISNALALLSYLQSIDPHVAFALSCSCAGFGAYVARTTPLLMATATFEHFDHLFHELLLQVTQLYPKESSELPGQKSKSKKD